METVPQRLRNHNRQPGRTIHTSTSLAGYAKYNTSTTYRTHTPADTTGLEPGSSSGSSSGRGSSGGSSSGGSSR
eukprot:11204328-Prorocentrum_lima.AAC.1